MRMKVLAAAFDRDKTERARNKFVETQMLIEALERHERRATNSVNFLSLAPQ
jgi:hypothetical protein